jgi:hypothetical protein
MHGKIKKYVQGFDGGNHTGVYHLVHLDVDGKTMLKLHQEVEWESVN